MRSIWIFLLMVVVALCSFFSHPTLALQTSTNHADIQMASHGVTNTASRADVNGDCVVDLLDLATVAQAYNSSGAAFNPRADVNGDGVVNLLDLVRIASNFDWRCPRKNILVAPSCSQFDAPGDDDSNLTQEYVCFRNANGSPANMSGWHVQEDRHGYLYTFPPFTLPGGEYVRLHTGVGDNTATDLYWGRDQAAWENTGDTVFLYDDEWTIVDVYRY